MTNILRFPTAQPTAETMPDLTCTNGDIWNALAVNDPSEIAPLVALSRADRPVRVTNNILKILRLARAEFEDIATQRASLLERCAKKDEDGKNVMLDEGRQVVLADAATFMRELEDLLAIPKILRDVHPVTHAELGEYPISAETLDKLGPFVVAD